MCLIPQNWVIECINILSDMFLHTHFYHLWGFQYIVSQDLTLISFEASPGVTDFLAWLLSPFHTSVSEAFDWRRNSSHVFSQSVRVFSGTVIINHMALDQFHHTLFLRIKQWIVDKKWLGKHEIPWQWSYWLCGQTVQGKVLSQGAFEGRKGDKGS